jgi:hypothetical protein
MFWRGLDPRKRSVAIDDIAAVFVFAWVLGVTGQYDGGPAVHGFLIAAAALLLVPQAAAATRDAGHDEHKS